MKIVVCLKQVPDMESRFKVIDELRIDDSQIAFKINDFDNYAVEAAIQLKEQFNGEVIIVTIGPDRAAKDMRQAFAMGADRGIHVNDGSLSGGDNFILASTLAGIIKEIGDVDLVLTGAQAEDDQAALTGVMIADMLGIPSCTNIIKLGFINDSGMLTVNRELEGGLNEIIELNIPALLTIQSGINEPRYPTLPGIMKAKKKPLDTRSVSDLGVKIEAKTSLVRMYAPQTESKVEILEGDAETTANSLVEKLKNEAKVI